MHMQRYFGALTIMLLLCTVWGRVLLLRRRGIEAMHFGKIDKYDVLIPPSAFFYFYLVFTAAFNWPTVASQRFFESGLVSWVGALCCVAGLIVLFLSLVTFGRSFRIGIDTSQPGKLATTGVFAFSRNPIYVAFLLILLGQFLIFSNPVLLVYMVAAVWLIHRQVLREEEYLRKQYGQEYSEYCSRVPKVSLAWARPEDMAKEPNRGKSKPTKMQPAAERYQ